MSENPGCLGLILRMFGVGPEEGAGGGLPYRQRDDFLSPAELSFHRALSTVVGDTGVVCPKVNLADVFFVVRPNENQGFRNKIDRKHVDFLVCDTTTMRPRLGIELDDRSHQRADRQERDDFVNSVFAVAGLPLLRIPAQSSYNVAELSGLLALHLGTSAGSQTTPTAPVEAAGSPVAPACPKCGVPMVLRTAGRGDRQGEKFYGCPNYPRCRETRPAA